MLIGTVAQLMAKQVTLNGTLMDAVAFTILHRYGIIEVAGTEQKPEGRRGKAGKIFNLESKEGMVFTCNQGE